MPQSDLQTVALSTIPANIISATESPWVPMSEGQWFRLLNVLPKHSGYVAQLKLEPGAVIQPHRHTGSVLAINLQGQRRLHTGETIGVGDFVYEPPGNIDTWKVVGEETLIVHIQVMGDVEYFDQHGDVETIYNATVMERAYRKFCEAQLLTPIEFGA